MVVQVVIPPIPAEGIVILAARTHGVWTTAVTAGLGLLAGSVLVFMFARALKARLDRFFRRDRVRRVLGHIRRHEDFILWLRILPYNPSDIISYASGLAGIPVRKYLGITVVTSFARCLALAAMGARIRSLDTLLQAGSVLVVSALAAHLVLFARKRPRYAAVTDTRGETCENPHAKDTEQR